MNKVKPTQLIFDDIDPNDFDKRRVEVVYNRLFREAWKRLLDKQSTKKYTKEQI